MSILRPPGCGQPGLLPHPRRWSTGMRTAPHLARQEVTEGAWVVEPRTTSSGWKMNSL